MFTERWPAIVSPNPGGPTDPLGESVLDPSQSWWRVFEPRDTRLVLGRGQDPERELIVTAAQADQIPVHRRVAGGGAVVLAPGMVVVALRLAPERIDPDCVFGRINQALIPAVAAVAGVAPACHGHGDLALSPGGDEPARKILGASLRQTASATLYLAVLMVDDAVPLMNRYLATPSRMPTYRAERGHAAFCTHLGRHGVTPAGLIDSISRAVPVGLADLAPTAAE